jgi:hypothetical protein
LTSQREAAIDGRPNNSAANRKNKRMKKHRNAEPQ